MKILMAASEVAPFSKTGGLADVVGALPGVLATMGHDVRIVTPMHRSIDFSGMQLSRPSLESLGVPMGGSEEWCAVHEGRMPGSEAIIYFIEHDRYWNRPHIYSDQGRDYPDNAERFAFLSRAACQLCKLLGWAPDVIHAHDWMTALAPVFLKSHYASDPILGGTASVLTIHNVGYQGEFPKEDLFRTGCGWEVFTPGGLEFHGRMNFLKGGILYADKVSTVSPTYAWEITTLLGGSGLDGALRARSPDLVGILNGLDYNEWNPSTDHFLPAKFDVNELAGKALCKAALQQEFDLPVTAEKPLVVMVSRLATQKGIDVLATALPAIFEMDLQFAVLGSGEIWSHYVFGDMPNRFPSKAGAFIGFNNAKAHRTYAGSDIFLMPSRYEPCGLGQMIAKRYGSLPVVRQTGGLSDTVTSFNESEGGGDGFSFRDLTPLSIANTIGWAVATWYDRPETFAALRDRAMRDRFAWDGSARRYLELYRWAAERRRAA